MGQQWTQEGPSTTWMEQVWDEFALRKNGPGIFKFRNVKILFRSFCPGASSPPWFSSFDNTCLHIAWMSDISGWRNWGDKVGEKEKKPWVEGLYCCWKEDWTRRHGEKAKPQSILREKGDESLNQTSFEFQRAWEHPWSWHLYYTDVNII